MSNSKARVQTTDLVPLAERVRYMQLFRGGTVFLVVAYALLVSSSRLGPGLYLLFAATAAYVLFAVGAQAFWQLSRRRGLALFGAMLIVDGVYLASVSYATGATASPLRLLILLHIIAVALLASYRTSLKVALWHSMLLFVVFYGQEAHILQPTPGGQVFGGAGIQYIAAFIVVFWLVAMATASFSAVNERELRRRRYDLEALANLASELESAKESATVAEIFLANVVDTFGFGRALLLGTPGEELSLMACRKMDPPSLTDPEIGRESVIKRVQESRSTALVSHLEASADPWLDAAFSGARNLVVLPLSAENRCIGVMVAEHSLASGSRIERRVVSTVERFASQAALALRNSWLLERVREMAATDALTGIANRRTFEATLRQDLARAARTGEHVSLVMVDIDHFKQVNDSLGHQGGDEVLCEVARILANHCREYDTAARYGGEEFAIILPGCAEAEAVATAERCRKAVAEIDTAAALTVSAGVATSTGHLFDRNILIQAADRALYQAKRAGRDRVNTARIPHVAELIDSGFHQPEAAAGSQA
jgi:two-component system, cell cycle response regulator